MDTQTLENTRLIAEFSAGTIEKIGHIMKMSYAENARVDLMTLKEISEIRARFFGENNYCTLVDIRNSNVEFTKEAKEFVTLNPIVKKLRVAEVILMETFDQKMEVHDYIRIFRHGDDVAVMTDEENAINWLNRKFNEFLESK